MNSLPTKDNKPVVFLITGFSYQEPITAHFNNLVAQLAPICKEILAVSGSDMVLDYENVTLLPIVRAVESSRGSASSVVSFWHQVTGYISRHLAVIRHLWRFYDRYDIVIFYVGASHFIVPMIFSKLLGKKIILIVAEWRYQMEKKGKRILPRSFADLSALRYGIFESIMRSQAHLIGVESKSNIELLGLERWRSKIMIFGAAFVDTDVFQITEDPAERKTIVGLIVRLVRSKGVAEFLQAIPRISRDHPNVNFLIGGKGELFDYVESEILKKGLTKRVELTGWIPLQDLASYLNRIKFLVLPSYTEGLPVIVQYAMACGTVVIATPVGGIPDLITDGVTGFIMKDNSPECIEANIKRAILHPDLKGIVVKARNLIETEYSYHTCVNRMKKAIGTMYNVEF
jgi:glycosyltransferase involved in cell wall biosynthesis